LRASRSCRRCRRATHAIVADWRVDKVYHMLRAAYRPRALCVCAADMGRRRRLRARGIVMAVRACVCMGARGMRRADGGAWVAMSHWLCMWWWRGFAVAMRAGGRGECNGGCGGCLVCAASAWCRGAVCVVVATMRAWDGGVRGRRRWRWRWLGCGVLGAAMLHVAV